MNRHDSNFAHARDGDFLTFHVFDEVIDVLVSHRIEPVAQLYELLEAILIPLGAFVGNPICKFPKCLPKSKIRKLLSEKSG